MSRRNTRATSQALVVQSEEKSKRLRCCNNKPGSRRLERRPHRTEAGVAGETHPQTQTRLRRTPYEYKQQRSKGATENGVGHREVWVTVYSGVNAASSGVMYFGYHSPPTNYPCAVAVSARLWAIKNVHRVSTPSAFAGYA